VSVCRHPNFEPIRIWTGVWVCHDVPFYGDGLTALLGVRDGSWRAFIRPEIRHHRAYLQEESAIQFRQKFENQVGEFREARSLNTGSRALMSPRARATHFCRKCIASYPGSEQGLNDCAVADSRREWRHPCRKPRGK
jgi:hypothetical protein